MLLLPFRRACLCALAVCALAVASPLSEAVAQVDSARGVRIGLRYDPGAKPGVLVMQITGANGDSIRTILQRDFDFSNRITNLHVPDGTSLVSAATGGGMTLNYQLLATMGAAAVVQITATDSVGGLHLALHDVGRATVAHVTDFALPQPALSREWRMAVHGISDRLVEWITGQPGIAQTRIAFIRDHVVHVIDSDGWGERELPVVGPAMSPAWHPDGHTVAYNTFGSGSRVVLHDLRTGRSRELGTQRNTTAVTPVFTPDGRSLVYGLSTEQGTDMYLVPLDANVFPRRITVGRGTNNLMPSFSPDGSRVAFMSDRAGHPQVYIMDADGTNVDIFTAFDFGDQNYRTDPDWSPDGRQVAFQSRIDFRFQVFTMTVRDRQPRQLTSEGQNEEPSWAPDGRHLALVSTRSGTRQIWILDTESGRLRQLTRVGGARLPAWSPRLVTP